MSWKTNFFAASRIPGLPVTPNASEESLGLVWGDPEGVRWGEYQARVVARRRFAS